MRGKTLLTAAACAALMTVSAMAAGIPAARSSMPVLVDGQDVAFDAYQIADYNYFKLRDIAAALAQTDSRFAVSYDAATRTIALTTGADYVLVGGELTAGLVPETAEADRSPVQVTVDGQPVQLEAYEIDGYHYFKLRDLGTALHFQVGFDEASRSVQIDSETASDAPEQPAAASDAEAVWTQVNAAREAAGLDPLALDDALCEAAQVRAEELAQVFDHTRPNGESCFTVLDEVDVGGYHTAGENIAMGYGDADSVMDGWMNSPGHRANILNEDFSRIGVAHAGQGWVQLFLG